jgi:large conductance mechanosensitive channel
MLNEFKSFIMRGNVMDLAVGVIIGGAFGAITASLVDDVLMPIIGAIFGGLDFSNYFAPLASGVTAATLDAAKEQGAVLAYGSFITAVINFLIIGFIVFMMVKAVNSMMKKEEEAPTAPPAPTKDQVLLQEIRDALVKTPKAKR